MACRSVEQIVAEIQKGAGFALVSEEALRTVDLQPLSKWLSIQPEWSDFPFILLTVRGGGLERNPAAGRYLDALGNVTFLERPFHPTTLVSLARSARRARQRQYDARGRLEELHALASDLEQRVEDRTAERQRALDQLHEAQKLETLGQLTGGVAHDFNNLLTPVIGALDLLRLKLEGQDARVDRWIDGALQSGERAKTLVQRLLGFARRQELQSGPVDIAALIKGIRDLIVSSIGPAIELHLQLSDNLPRAIADPNQLELAVLNLCVNARDAMDGGGKITIAAEVVEVGLGSSTKLSIGDYICLSVIDTGAGMDAATLARAVEPFFSTKDVGRGTGLGLSMVHGLSAQLNGAFILDSAPGKGTRAELYLPATQDRVSVSRGISQAMPGEIAPPRVILLVDDEELVRRSTAEMLRGLGHHVVEAEGGDQALATLAATPDIELVITDYKMPRMDGAELAQRIRARQSDMPILLISGYTGAADPIEGLTRLDKPFGLRELMSALQRTDYCHNDGLRSAAIAQ